METLLYPQNLDVDKLLDNKSYSPTIKKNIKTRILKMVNKLYPTNYNRHSFNVDGYRNISSKFKKRIFGNYYNEIHELIIDCENPIIEMDNHYIVGEKSKSYRLIDVYRNADPANYEYRISLSVRKKTRKNDYLTHQFYLHKLSFDNRVYDYLNNFYSTIKNKLSTENEITLLKNYLGRNLNIIDDINNNRIYHNRSYTNRRFNSTITSLNKIIRPFLLVNNQLLYSIDIKASQPYVLASIMDMEFYSKNKQYNFYSIGRTRGIYLFPRFLKKRLDGIKNYREIPFDQDFYSFVLRKEFNREPTTQERDRLKHKTMQFLFFNNSKAKEKKELSYLVNQFPSVHRFITACLDHIKEKHFAYLLQRAESYLVLDVIAKEFYNAFPNHPFFTIHDSIMTTKDKTDFTLKLMESRLEDLTGIKPGVKLELPDLSIHPSEYVIDTIITKIRKRAKNYNDRKDAVEVLETNLKRTEEFLKNNSNN